MHKTINDLDFAEGVLFLLFTLALGAAAIFGRLYALQWLWSVSAQTAFNLPALSLLQLFLLTTFVGLFRQKPLDANKIDANETPVSKALKASLFNALLAPLTVAIAKVGIWFAQ